MVHDSILESTIAAFCTRNITALTSKDVTTDLNGEFKSVRNEKSSQPPCIFKAKTGPISGTVETKTASCNAAHICEICCKKGHIAQGFYINPNSLNCRLSDRTRMALQGSVLKERDTQNWKVAVCGIAIISKSAKIVSSKFYRSNFYTLCGESSVDHDLERKHLLEKVCFLHLVYSGKASKQSIWDSKATASVFKKKTKTKPSSYESRAVIWLKWLLLELKLDILEKYLFDFDHNCWKKRSFKTSQYHTFIRRTKMWQRHHWDLYQKKFSGRQSLDFSSWEEKYCGYSSAVQQFQTIRKHTT